MAAATSGLTKIILRTRTLDGINEMSFTCLNCYNSPERLNLPLASVPMIIDNFLMIKMYNTNLQTTVLFTACECSGRRIRKNVNIT